MSEAALSEGLRGREQEGVGTPSCWDAGERKVHQEKGRSTSDPSDPGQGGGSV